jgi:mRNA interferase RelE/StbE
VRDYKLTIASKAWKDLEALPSALAQRVDAAILALALEPRPHGVKKLKGERTVWRVRVGDYRIVFSIDDNLRVVDIIGIPHRSKAYK